VKHMIVESPEVKHEVVESPEVKHEITMPEARRGVPEA
jgi:hypothetical protein